MIFLPRITRYGYSWKNSPQQCSVVGIGIRYTCSYLLTNENFQSKYNRMYISITMITFCEISIEKSKFIFDVKLNENYG